MKTIWQDLPKPFFALAPMEAVTDTVFRRVVVKAAKPDLFFSEFTNATGWVHAGDKAVAGRLDLNDPDLEQPVIAQIWGANPEDIAKLAAHCKELGYKGIDINMGCPEKTATKSGGGAACIQNPELANKIIAAAKTAGLPVSVKTRLGYSKLEEWQAWLGNLLKQDVAALTIHLRTKKEMSKVPAHWELMPEIKQLRDELAPETLLIGNGDVESRAHGQKLLEESGIDGVMIGRGIFTNIFAFEKERKEHSKQELLAILDYHLKLFQETHTEDRSSASNRPYETLKRFYKIYVRNFAGSGRLRAALMSTHSVEEAKAILKDAKELDTVAETSQKQFAGLGHIRYHVEASHSVKAIVFDSDGTLVNTTKLILYGFQTVLKRHGLDHLTTESYITQRLGKPVPETYEQLLAGQDTGLSVDQLVKEHDEVQNQNIHLIKPYPEAQYLLKEWRKQGIKLCLFTSGNLMMIKRNFAAAGIQNVTDLFDEIITADDDIPRKPEPDAVLELLRRVDIAAEDAVVVGDHPYDIQSGTQAHAGLTIGILHGFGESRDLLIAGADFLSDDLGSLNNLLKLSVES
jgi:HAD superfamily hydrolase (TIGR01549 family)